MRGRVDFVLGGIRSGKSSFAEGLALAASATPHFIATAEPIDESLTQRIRQHQARRDGQGDGQGGEQGRVWIVHEEPLAIAACLESLDDSDNVVVVDCINMWLNNLHYHKVDERAEEQHFLRVLQEFRGYAIIVSAEVGLSLVPSAIEAARFCDELGLLNQAIAAQATRVIQITAGLPHILKESLQ